MTARPYDTLSSAGPGEPEVLCPFICTWLKAKIHCQNDRAIKGAREPKDRLWGRTSQRGTEDETPSPVDIDIKVRKKGHKEVDQIISESDNNVAITENVRKESRPIIISKVWLLVTVKLDACGPLA